MQWISVKDSLPTEMVKVLVYYCTDGMSRSYHISVGQLQSRGKFSGEFDWTYATHWMPLPSPPKTETKCVN